MEQSEIRSHGRYTKFNEDPEGTQPRKRRRGREGYVSLQWLL
jgi:hypothetical protein